MRVLISGFDPFGGFNLNPTSLLVSALEKREIPYPPSLRVEQILLPVTFRESFNNLQEKIREWNPDVVIALGQAAHREAIEIESVAVNRIDTIVADNLGEAPQNQFINASGEPAYFSTLPIQGLYHALKSAGLPVNISNSGGNINRESC